jgi:hypothetical protein
MAGDTRAKIASDNSIGLETVSNIVNDWKKGLKDADLEVVRELAVESKEEGLTLSDLALCSRLHNFIKKLGADEDQLESFIANLHGNSTIPREKIVDLTNQLFDI